MVVMGRERYTFCCQSKKTHMEPGEPSQERDPAHKQLYNKYLHPLVPRYAHPMTIYCELIGVHLRLLGLQVVLRLHLLDLGSFRIRRGFRFSIN